MEESGIVFKATANGLIIILKEEYDFQELISHIEKKLLSAGKFFKGASIAVKYRGKKLSKSEEDEIVKLMSLKTDAHIISFEEDTSSINTLPDTTPHDTSGRTGMKLLFFTGIDEGMTKFHRGTVRSGQLVSYDGNVVVIGDVNPGGEVEATGNVVVMGSLRGMVHAGADGNKDAVIVALNLKPMQLRIADVITRSPDDEDHNGAMVPELAYVRDDMVYIERFLPQFKQFI